MENSVKKVSDALVELLCYLDTPGKSNISPLVQFIEYRRKLGDDCSINSSYIYSILTRKDIWKVLGNLWKALYEHSITLRKTNDHE